MKHQILINYQQNLIQNQTMDLPECNLAMPNGFGTFIQQIVQQHQLPVELNSIVTRIDTNSLSDSIVRIYTEDKRLFLCKYVLMTIPLGCLKVHSIEFLPNLPEWKQNAIDADGCRFIE